MEIGVGLLAYTTGTINSYRISSLADGYRLPEEGALHGNKCTQGCSSITDCSSLGSGWRISKGGGMIMEAGCVDWSSDLESYIRGVVR